MKFDFWRSLGLVIAVALTLGILLTVLERLVYIYSLLAVLSPWLGGGVVLGIVLIASGSCWWGIRALGFWRPQRPRSAPQVSTDRAIAADQNLQALQQQVNQIQDQVARQALLDQSSDLRQSLTNPAFKLVIFGTGSAGKTSLVNALLNLSSAAQVGEVAVTMGTTLFGEIYQQVQLPGLAATLDLVDCPGILESGAAGQQRGEIARDLATTADLLLFVIDHDLTQSEFATLTALLELGKRSLLVLNKIDLYAKTDWQILQAHLQTRTQSWLDPADVVAIAAHPQPRTLEDGQAFYPQPRLQPLLERISGILTRDGHSLIADNVLQRSQQLSETARHLLQTQRQAQANQVIERYQWLVVGVVFSTPLPVIDLLATAAINAQMITELAKIYGCEITLDQAKELAASLSKTMASLGLIKGVVRLITTAISVTIVGHLVRATVQAVTAAYLTRIAGYSFVTYFSQNQDWGDGGIAEVVEQQFQLNRREQFMQQFIKEAIQRALT
ncbi:MAG: GTP-binding protein [Pseudanabaenaceae cyanobacterium bins.68]|nr:GTP-binding protein [Pseudanabaenaceae cyanobacterium bins.68]